MDHVLQVKSRDKYYLCSLVKIHVFVQCLQTFSTRRSQQFLQFHQTQLEQQKQTRSMQIQQMSTKVSSHHGHMISVKDNNQSKVEKM